MSKGWHGCCDCCVIHSDNFTRADSVSMGEDWSEYAGDCDINGNTADLRSDNTGVISQLYDRSAELDGQVVRGTVRCAEVGVQARMIGGAVVGEATDRYWYAQYEQTSATAGTLSLYLYEDGTGHTQYGTDVTVSCSLSTNCTLSLCLVPENRTSGNGIATAAVTIGSTVVSTQSGTVSLPTHEKCGFGCGTAATSAGNLTVDDWEGRRSSLDDTVDNCPDCFGTTTTISCSACSTGSGPRYILVDFDGVTGDDSCCDGGATDNGVLNTAHIVSQGATFECNEPAGVTCTWGSPPQVGNSCYSSRAACVFLTYDSSSNTTQIEVVKTAPTNVIALQFQTTVSGKPDCESWSGYTITNLVSDNGSCTVTGASVALTAI